MLYYTILYCGTRTYHACGKSMVQSKIKQYYYPRSENSLQSMDVIDILIINSSILNYTIGKLKVAASEM